MEIAANYAYTLTVNPLCRKCLVLPVMLAVGQEFWSQLHVHGGLSFNVGAKLFGGTGDRPDYRALTRNRSAFLFSAFPHRGHFLPNIGSVQRWHASFPHEGHR